MPTPFLCANPDNSPEHKKIYRIANKMSKRQRKARKSSDVIVRDANGIMIQIGKTKLVDVI